MLNLSIEMVNECPYLPTMTDEVSGVEVPNIKFEIWCNGYIAGVKACRRLIDEQIKMESGLRE